MTWQAKANNEGLKQGLWDLEKALEQAQEDKRDIHEEMTQQYQELQKQTAAQRQHLEVKVKSLQEQLATRLQESEQTQEAATQALAERGKTIAQLQASQHWEEVGTTITVEHKERLQEFGLLETEHSSREDKEEHKKDVHAGADLSRQAESSPKASPGLS
ncbi:LOW QUALITY PROTEIN: dynein regulatory complex protein 12 [Leptosomus discolor]